jgi:hypothetical protein
VLERLGVAADGKNVYAPYSLTAMLDVMQSTYDKNCKTGSPIRIVGWDGSILDPDLADEASIAQKLIAEVKQKISFKEEPVASESPTFRSFDQHLEPKESSSQAGAALERYRMHERDLHEAYSNLSARDAILERGALAFLPILFSLGWIGWEFVTRFANIEVSSIFISTANAAAVAVFQPPFGLSQAVFTAIVCLFTALLFILVVAFAWAGFFATKKSAKAATIVEHFASLVLGAFFGTKM